MEKYKRWTDEATGVNPFVPYYKKKAAENLNFFDSFLGKVVGKLIISPILLLIKLPLLTVFFLTSIIFTIIANLIPIWPLSRFFQRYAYALVFRTILFFMGFYDISTQYYSSSGRKIKASGIGKLISGLNSGDLIVANHVSYIEVLYLAYRYAPVFASVVYDTKREEAKVVRQTVYSYLFDVLFQRKPSIEGAEKLSKLLVDAKNKHLGPVVLFPEATTSNGKSILRYQNVFDSEVANVLKNTKVHIIGFQFKYLNFSPCYHINYTYLTHLLKLCSQFYNTMNVHIVEGVDLFADGEFSLKPLRDTLEQLLNVKQVKLGLSDKEKFIEYWNQTQNSGYFAQ